MTDSGIAVPRHCRPHPIPLKAPRACATPSSQYPSPFQSLPARRFQSLPVNCRSGLQRPPTFLRSHCLSPTSSDLPSQQSVNAMHNSCLGHTHKPKPLSICSRTTQRHSHSQSRQPCLFLNCRVHPWQREAPLVISSNFSSKSRQATSQSISRTRLMLRRAQRNARGQRLHSLSARVQKSGPLISGSCPAIFKALVSPFQ